MSMPSAQGASQENKGARRRVLIVDDHPIVRQGLKRMIETEPDMEVCGEAATEAQARRAIRELMPDIVIVDLALQEGDGLELVRDVHAHHPDVPMLVLSMHDETIYAERLLAEGASGYIMKQAAADQLLNALRAVLRGDEHGAHRDALLMGAALALELTGAAASPGEGVERASRAIADGTAARVLDALAGFGARMKA